MSSHKITDEALASLMNVSVRTVQSWKRGERTPSVDSVRLLSNYLQCDIATLMSDAP